MILVFGTRLYGKVRRCRETYLATRFFHLSFLPVVPLATHAVIGPSADSRGYRYLRARLDLRSVAAAYLRTWGVVIGIYLVLRSLGTFSDAMEARAWGDLLTAPLLVFATLGTLVAAFFSLGRLNEDQQQQQEVYARFVGAPIDPALLDERRLEVRRQVVDLLGTRAGSLGLLGYRQEGAGDADWTALALSPAVRDLDYLEAALTLARLEWDEAPSADRRPARRQRHHAIWLRLRELRTASTPAARHAPTPA